MIDVCPQCGYSLRGLPANHRCPECGLRYDQQSEVFRHTRPRALFTGLAGFAGGLGGTFTLLRHYPSFSAAGKALTILGFIVYYGGFALLARYVYKLYRAGPLVAVLPEGLLVRLRKAEGEHTRWADIANAVVRPGALVVELVIKDKRSARPIAGVFKTRVDAERLVRLVTERMAAVSSERGVDPDP